MYGETFRSVREERKSTDELNCRRSAFWDSTNNKLKERKTARLVRKSIDVDKQINIFKAFKPKVNHPEDLDTYNKNKKREYIFHDKLHGQRQVIKNKIIKEFFKKHRDPNMRRMSNPFNITPIQEFMLQTEVEKTKFVPNTSIPMDKSKKVSNYMKLDLLDLSQKKAQTFLKPEIATNPKSMKKKAAKEEEEQLARMRAQEKMISNLVTEKVKDNDSTNCDDSRHNFDVDHNAASSEFLAQSYKEMQENEKTLIEIERLRNLKVIHHFLNQILKEISDFLSIL